MQNTLTKGQEVRHTFRNGQGMIGIVERQEGQNVYVLVGKEIFKFHIDELRLVLNTKHNSKRYNEMIMKGWDSYYSGKEGKTWVVYFKFNLDRHNKIMEGK